MSAAGVVVFLCFIGATLGITWWAGKKNKSVDDHLVAGGNIGGRQNGFAIVGDAISASTFRNWSGPRGDRVAGVICGSSEA